MTRFFEMFFREILPELQVSVRISLIYLLMSVIRTIAEDFLALAPRRGAVLWRIGRRQ
jgi:hypothetical protein